MTVFILKGDVDLFLEINTLIATFAPIFLHFTFENVFFEDRFFQHVIDNIISV